MIKTMRTEAKAYFIEGIDENRKNGVEISELDNIIYKNLLMSVGQNTQERFQVRTIKYIS